MIKRSVLIVLVVAFVAGCASVASVALGKGFGRDALGVVVAACHISESTIGLPFPCTRVKLASPGDDGYAIIRSPGFASEFLLSPLAPIPGIESPALQAATATNLWSAAWEAREDVAKALGQPLARNDVGLAVNAQGTRTQDHFHIHIDCVSRHVKRMLAAHMVALTPEWQIFPVELWRRTYWVRTLASSDLEGINVARLLSLAPQAAHVPLAHATVAVVATTLPTGKDGFVLFANWTNSSAERLLDHDCMGR